MCSSDKLFQLFEDEEICEPWRYMQYPFFNYGSVWSLMPRGYVAALINRRTLCSVALKFQLNVEVRLWHVSRESAHQKDPVAGEIVPRVLMDFSIKSFDWGKKPSVCVLATLKSNVNWSLFFPTNQY